MFLSCTRAVCRALTRAATHRPPPPLPPLPPLPPATASSLLAQRLAAYKAQEDALMGGASSGLTTPALPSSSDAAESRPASLAPAAAPEASASTPSLGSSSLKALELRSGLEGGVANGAYLPHLRSGAYYSYASPPPLGEAYLFSPPPLVYVKEVVTTVTTTYPAGTPVPATAAPEQDGDVGFEPYGAADDSYDDSYTGGQ